LTWRTRPRLSSPLSRSFRLLRRRRRVDFQANSHRSHTHFPRIQLEPFFLKINKKKILNQIFLKPKKILLKKLGLEGLESFPLIFKKFY